MMEIILITIFLIIAGTIPIFIWLIYTFFSKYSKSKGKYGKFDYMIIPHNIQKQHKNFFEKHWEKYGLKWYRLIFYTKNGFLHSIISISEANIIKIDDYKIFLYKKLKTAYIIDDNEIKEENGVPVLTYYIGIPKPLHLEKYDKPDVQKLQNDIQELIKKQKQEPESIPKKDKELLKKLMNKYHALNVQFFNGTELYNLASGQKVKQLVYDENKDKILSYITYIGLICFANTIGLLIVILMVR